jgi:hypothetical protein
MKWETMKRTFGNLPRGARRKLLHKIPAQYELIGCFAGETEKFTKKFSNSITANTPCRSKVSAT